MKTLSIALLIFTSTTSFAQDTRLTTEIFSVTPPTGLQTKHNKRDLIQFGGQAQSNSSYPNPFIVIEYCARNPDSEAYCSKKIECNANLLLKRLKDVPENMRSDITTQQEGKAIIYSIKMKQPEAYMSAALLCHANGMAYAYIVSAPKAEDAETTFDGMLKSIQWK